MINLIHLQFLNYSLKVTVYYFGGMVIKDIEFKGIKQILILSSYKICNK